MLDWGGVQAFTSLPLSFLRIIGLILYWVKSKLAATPRAKARVWSEQRYHFGSEAGPPPPISYLLSIGCSVGQKAEHHTLKYALHMDVIVANMSGGKESVCGLLC